MWNKAEIELNGTLYQRIGSDWYDASTYISAPIAVSRKLEDQFRKLRTAIRPKQVNLAQKNGQVSFHHAEAFPIVADVIRTCCEEANAYITHDTITNALLAHSEGYRLARTAASKLGKPVEWAASNMVSWFSKRFTEGKTSYQELFERARVDGRWAYRLRSASASAD